MLRGSAVCGVSIVVLNHGSHIEVDEHEIVRGPLNLVHDVVDADIAVQYLGLIS